MYDYVQDTMMIFSYGTLINPRTRALTGRSGRVYPARLHGYIRRWNARIHRVGTTVLGIQARAHSHVNGLLVEYDDADITLFDQRERGYDRMLVDPGVIDVDPDVKEDIYVYIPQKPTLADDAFPIPLTYLDAAIAGCLDISHEFAREFVQTTIDWDRPLLDDRADPRYPRALSGLPHEVIDSIIHPQICSSDRCRFA